MSSGRIHALIIKLAERCNLNCSYCYMYNHEDQSYLNRPHFMSDEIFDRILHLAKAYTSRSHAPHSMWLIFHGGEPTLLNVDRFANFVRRAREVLGHNLAGMSIQTNATLIDEHWCEVLKSNGIEVGVSIDGPRTTHDLVRVDQLGRGSHTRTVEGLRRLQAAGLKPGVLCVVQPEQSGLDSYKYIRSLDVSFIDFLIPDVTHDSIGRLYGRRGTTPVADYLIPIFDEWFTADNPDVKIHIFWNAIKQILGGASTTEIFGNYVMAYLVIETDGDIEALDALKVCAADITKSGLNVLTHSFDDLGQALPLVHRLVGEGLPLPTGCRDCADKAVCGGGYPPHRYSRQREFDNPSVWCADIKRLLRHIRTQVEG